MKKQNQDQAEREALLRQLFESLAERRPDRFRRAERPDRPDLLGEVFAEEGVWLGVLPRYFDHRSGVLRLALESVCGELGRTMLAWGMGQEYRCQLHVPGVGLADGRGQSASEALAMAYVLAHEGQKRHGAGTPRIHLP